MANKDKGGKSNKKARFEEPERETSGEEGQAGRCRQAPEQDHLNPDRNSHQRVAVVGLLSKQAAAI